MSPEFLAWFDEWKDPNIGLVETSVERQAAWAAWQAAQDNPFTFAGFIRKLSTPKITVEILETAAKLLIMCAEQDDLVLRIETVPLQPLRMGNYKMVADVRPKREPR